MILELTYRSKSVFSIAFPKGLSLKMKHLLLLDLLL